MSFVSAPSHPGRYLLGGILLILLAAGGFVASVYSNLGTLSLHALATLPTMIAVSLFARAFSSRKSVRRVTVDASGITTEYPSQTRHIDWDTIAWSEGRVQALSNRKQLVLYGSHAETIEVIPDAITAFDDLDKIVSRRIKSKPHVLADLVRLKRLKRQSWLVFTVGILLCAVGTFLFLSGLSDRQAQRRLDSESIDGTATVKRKFLAPDGVTKRIEYRVDAKRTDGKSPSLMNVELQPSLWDVIQEGQKLPVRYVRDSPDISEMSWGEVKDDNLSPTKLIIVGLAATLFGIIACVVGFFNRRGIDIVIDSETKKIRVARSARREV